ncbi:hypothetical protein [Vibrio sp. SCSIO 43136]|uniref:hypothetical protein n=1 Tax=Vibrio sp. SCSIO 43136 TaxID=2819101 RepID=UPI00207502F4|nr:hypothetical protein [Vibrio sp. SCSIO 43136]USD67837.1 hypothetical protein J4N39_16765 [Vibrio sp. SCSIO 43136]
MNQYANVLQWDNPSIPHRLWIEQLATGGTRLCMKVVKDVEPEILSLDLPATQAQVLGAWIGHACPISGAYDRNSLYSQVRSLLNLPLGCVIWTVNHIELPGGEKMSADKLAWVPQMHSKHGHLEAIL